MLHEGTPVGLRLYPPTVQAAQDRNLRIIVIARPGYELSTPRPGRRVVDVAADTAAVLDALGLDRFVTAGWSGGGPHALACVAALPPVPGRRLDRRGRALRRGGPGLAGGMGPENVAEFDAAVRGARYQLPRPRGARIGSLTGEAVASGLGGLIVGRGRRAS